VRYRLAFVRVFVTDWERALRFYTESLGMPIMFRDDDLGWAQLATGAAQLALERADPSDAESTKLVGRFVGASLAVNDLHALYETLRERGVDFTAPPTTQPWGAVLTHVRDPDGNVLTLVGTPGQG